MGVAKTHALIPNQRNGEACHTVYTTKYARKDRKSNSKDIEIISKKCSEKGQRKKEWHLCKESEVIVNILEISKKCTERDKERRRII